MKMEWKGDGPVAIDTETCPFGPGDMAPNLVVMSWADAGGSGLRTSADHDPSLDFEDLLETERPVIMHNGAYDLVVLARAAGVQVRRYDPPTTPRGYRFLALLWAALDRGQIRDTRIRHQLKTIAEGTFKAERKHNSLGYLATMYLGWSPDKSDDGWRLRYGELEHVRLANWPPEPVAYATEDAEATLGVFHCQEDNTPWPPHYFQEEARQVKAAFALQLLCAWGIRADGEAAKALRIDLTASMRKWESELLEAGILKKKRSWDAQGGYKAAKAKAKAEGRKPEPDYVLSKDMKTIRERVVAALGARAPLTDKGQISTAKEVLLDTDDDLLIKLADRGTYEKTLGFVDILDKATGERPFCPHWNSLMETGRTSCGSPDDPGNLQNQPRAPGVRECYVAAPGNVYVACDYDTAELRALSQVLYTWFGWSKMREAIIAGRDIHQEVADQLDWLDRQGAKPFNFGLPGGLGNTTLIKYVKSYSGGKTVLSRKEAQEARDAWFKTWPEMRLYFDRIAEYSRHGKARMKAFWSGRVRGGMSFSQAANGMFQSLVADGAKKALVEVVRACYSGVGPLANFRVVAFIHDELILEGPVDEAHDAAMEVERIMCEEMQEVMPDVPVTASAHLMFRWYKKAKAVRDAQGRLVPWEPGKAVKQ